MAIFSQGPNPASQATPWSQALGPIAQSADALASQYRQKQQNIAQSSMLQSVINEISQNPNAGLNDILGLFAQKEQQGLNPEHRQQYLQNWNQDRLLQAKENAAEGKKETGGAAALQTLQRMREIQSTGHLGGKFNVVGTGRKFLSTFSKEGQRLRAEYERLGKSLIQSSTNIPIRNRQEFETLAHDLYDTTKSNEEILGTLDAMERIIRQSLGQLPENQPISTKTAEIGRTQQEKNIPSNDRTDYEQKPPSAAPQKPPLTSFYR